jgi:hypothetical protein
MENARESMGDNPPPLLRDYLVGCRSSIFSIVSHLLAFQPNRGIESIVVNSVGIRRFDSTDLHYVNIRRITTGNFL